MKAAFIGSFDGPTSVFSSDVGVPNPGPSEVRIRVKAAGLNNSDLQTTYGTYRHGYQEFPHILGQEAAGYVEAVGSDVEVFRPGMRVLGPVRGAFAELAIASAAELIPLPEEISFEVAASLPIAYLTASLALIHKAKCQAGEWVLIHPGSGGVGTAAIQLTKLLGARAIATVGQAHKIEPLLKLGADFVLDYSAQTVPTEVLQITEGQGVQVAVDGGGTLTLPDCLACMANEGRMISYGYTTGIEASLPLAKLLGKNITLQGIALWYNSDYQASLATLRDLILPAVAAGTIQPLIDRVIPLNDLADALILMEQRQLTGKVVVVPDYS